MKLFNTINRKIEEFKPISDKKVGLYTCGPTVYDYAHIGNFRTYLFEDVLRRTLLFLGYDVKQVMNITDVGHLTSDEDTGEDKIEKGAKREHKSAYDIARFYEEAFKKDLKLLNIETPEIFPRATEHITDQIDLIKILERKGYTYGTTDGIYMDTSKVRDYGKLARLNIEGQQEGARVEKNAEKRNPSDFALWKFSPKDTKREMEWPSPWGTGFPGWHLECSAMSVKYLGQPFDIHTGGVDHIPVHHTNEIAQSESAFDKPLANYWLHSEFLKIDGGKMSKSLRNIYTLSDLKKKGFDPLDFRYLCLQAHYRSKLNFTWEALEGAKNARTRLMRLISTLSHPDSSADGEGSRDSSPAVQNDNYLMKFKEKISTDLNTPEALAVVWELLRDEKIDDSEKFATLIEMDKVLGLDIGKKVDIEIPPNVKNLVSERKKARADKDWAKSDEIRKEIESLGYIVEDTGDGTKVVKK